MLEQISRLTVRLAELAEAEGRVFREHLDRLFQRLLMLLTAAVLALGGLVVLAVGVYLRLAESLGRAWAAVLLGLALVLLGGVIFSLASAFGGSLPDRRNGRAK